MRTGAWVFLTRAVYNALLCLVGKPFFSIAFSTFLPGPRVHIAVVHKSLLLSEILLFLCFLRVGHFYPWCQSSRSRLVQSARISFVSKRFEFVRVLRIVVKMNYEQRENYIQTLISEAVFVALSILLSLPCWL